MNNSIEARIEIGIGPQLVILGTILGSLFVGTITKSITGRIDWDEISVISNNRQKTEKYIESQSFQDIDNGSIQKPGENILNATNPQYQNISADEQCQVSITFIESILRWCDEITKYSMAYDISPDLIAAVILQESGGNPNAYSHSGAVGLMQVMPRDGIAANFICVNGPCFSNRPTMSELQEPTFNIEYGTRMLANLNAKYGNIREALRYYGPMDVGYSYADKVLAIYENHR